MFKPKIDLPFEEITNRETQEKAIPRKPNEFVQYIEYLATSPQLDASIVTTYLLQFLKLPNLKDDVRKLVYFAMRDLSLPNEFWADFLKNVKADINTENACAESLLIALSNAPANVILSEMNNFTFLNQFCQSEDQNLRYAGFYALYAFRNYIKIEKAIVNEMLKHFQMKTPRLIFITIKLVNFLITVDYPEIKDLLKPCKVYFISIINLHGHLLNIEMLESLINWFGTDIQSIMSVLPHVSFSSQIYILSKLPSLKDFNLIANYPPSAIIPNIISILEHPLSEGMRVNLVLSAIQIIKKTQSHRYFDELVDYFLKTNYSYEFSAVAMFVDVASSFNELGRLLSKANECAKQKELFSDLVAISAMVGSQTNTDVLNGLLKLLLSQKEVGHWTLAASTIAYYMWEHKNFIIPKIQMIFEMVRSIKLAPIRSLFLIYIANFIPQHLQTNLIQNIKELLFPSKYINEKTKNNNFVKCEESQIPLVIQLALVYTLFSRTSEEDIKDIKDELSDPLYALTIEHCIASKKAEALNNKRQRRMSVYDMNATISNVSKEPLASAFSCCDVIDLGILASSLSLRPHIESVKRDFIEISPIYHAMTIEVASIVNPKYRTICLDLRVSSKGVVPSVTITLDVPEVLTPSQVPEWEIKSLQEGTKVTNRFSFTVDKLTNPFAMISVIQEDIHVLDIKVCLPLIDIFQKVKDMPELSNSIWEKLHYEKRNVNLSDSLYASPYGCIQIHDGVARSNCNEFLDMIPSIVKTSSVVS